MKTETSSVEQVGEVVEVVNHGTVIAVTLKTDDGKWIPIYFDHRPFGWLIDAEGCEPQDLVGRRASYDGNAIRFLD